MPNTKKGVQNLEEKDQVFLGKKEFAMQLVLKTNAELEALEEYLTEEMDKLALSIIDKTEKLKQLKEKRESVSLEIFARQEEKEDSTNLIKARELIKSI